jgi:hypothetical protein
VGEHLPRKPKTLSSNSSTAKTQNKKSADLRHFLCGICRLPSTSFGCSSVDFLLCAIISGLNILVQFQNHLKLWVFSNHIFVNSPAFAFLLWKHTRTKSFGATGDIKTLSLKFHRNLSVT